MSNIVAFLLVAVAVKAMTGRFVLDMDGAKAAAAIALYLALLVDFVRLLRFMERGSK